MSEQIKKSDVSEKDIYGYVIESAKIAEKQIADLNLELKKSAEISKGILSKTKFTDSQSIKEAEKQIKLANIQMIEAERLENNLIKVKADRIKAERLLSTEIERETKATERSNMAKEKSTSVYARVDKWLGALVREYRELAVRQQLGAKLTDAEIKRMETLSGRISKYDKALKDVDATSGKHFRNVGNYKSAYNGLGNSITQLTREMPAFGNSMQTGFMAISNNLPIFFDEIQKLKQANIELQASGEPTKSIFKQLGSAIFSVGTALSVGVTLLTVFGAKLVDWLFTNSEVNKQLEEQRKAQKLVNEETKRSSEYVGKESAELVGLFVQLKNTNEGSKERIGLINQINDKYGLTLKNLSDEAKFQAVLNTEIIKYINYQRTRYQLDKFRRLEEMNIAKQDKISTELKMKFGYTQKQLDQILQNSVALQGSYAGSLEVSDQKVYELITTYNKLLAYGERVANLTNGLTDDYTNNSKATKESTQSLEDYTRAVKDLQDAMIVNERDRERTQLETQFKNELADIKGNGIKANEMKIELRKKYEFDLRSLEEKFRLEDEAKKNEENQKELERQERIREIEFENIILEEKEKKLALLQGAKTKKEIDKETKQNHIEALKEQIELSKLYGKETVDLEIELAELLRQQEEEKQKEILKMRKDFVDLSLQYFIKQSEEKIKQIDKEIQASEKQQSILEELAKNGNITAQQSLAENERITKEANERKLKEQKRIERLKLAQTAFDVYGKKVEAGEKNPLISTIKDIELLRAFINSLPAFESGTENTGTNGQGIDGKGGFLSVLHPNERVLTAEQNAKIGELSNIELAKVASDYNSGKIINLNHVGAVAGNSYDLIPLLSELKDLKHTVQNMPSNNIELGEITQHTMQIVQTSKRGNITNRRTYFIKK